MDPEALVLATLVLREHERRLDRVMRLWIGGGSRLLSTGRVANLLRDYPESVAPKVAEFAAQAVAEADARWHRLAGKATARAGSRRGVEAPSPHFRQPSTLMLRLRLALGVGIKADALAFLLGRVGVPATVREIASGTGYFERAVRRAVDDLVAARLLDVQATSPISYYAKWANWGQLLGVDENSAPLSRWWHELYIGVHPLDQWAGDADASKWAPYVAGSRLRDVFERMEPLLLRAQVRERLDWSQPPEVWMTTMGGCVEEMAYRMRAVV